MWNLSRPGRSLTLLKWLAILLVPPASALCGSSVYEVDWLDAVRKSQYEVSLLASLEPQSLHRDGERATRSGNVLTVWTGPKRAQHFVDGVGCSAEEPSIRKACVRFLYLGYSVRSRMYYVYEAHYEGGFWLLLNRNNGRAMRFDGFPEVSPNGEAILVLRNNDQDGPSGVEIWGADGADFVKQYSGIPINHPESGASRYIALKKWLSESSVQLTIEQFVPGKKLMREKCALLQRHGSSWVPVDKAGCDNEP